MEKRPEETRGGGALLTAAMISQVTACAKTKLYILSTCSLLYVSYTAIKPKLFCTQS